MKKYLIAGLSVIAIVLLVTIGFGYVFNEITLLLGNFNEYLAQTLKSIGQYKYAGLTLVGASFLYGILHAIGPGHGKFVLSSYAIANNPKFYKLLILALSISLLQGLTAVIIGTVALQLLSSSVSNFLSISNNLVFLSCTMLALLGLFWMIRALFRLYKLYVTPEEDFIVEGNNLKEQDKLHHEHHEHDEHVCCSHHCSHHDHNHNHNHDHNHDEHLHNSQDKNCSLSSHESSCGCSNHHESHNHEHHSHEHHNHHDNNEKHVHGASCGCKNHLDLNKFVQVDNLRDRIIMASSVILRPCTGAIFVLIFAYSVNLWW